MLPRGMKRPLSPLPPRVAGALPPLDSAALRREISALDPAGCVVDCSIPEYVPPPGVFGNRPVVWLDNADPLRRRGAVTIGHDNMAIASAAFRELSSSLPSAYAVSPYHFRRKWSEERTNAFIKLCRTAGKRCYVFDQHYDDDIAERRPRRAAWAASLPDRVAVFAVNDFEAREMARAFADARRSVPRSATIVGVDGFDTIPYDEYVPSATVSSVKLDYEQLGFMAARAVAEAGHAFSLRIGPLMVVRRQSTSGRGRHAPFVLEALETIRREASAGLTAASLAARFPFSRNLFERRFREATGHSVLDEILYVRLQSVQALLLRSDVEIGAIAGRCGFGTESELRGLFRARFGISMRQWRAQHLRCVSH